MASCVCTDMSMLRELYQQVLIEVPSVGSVVPICQRALGRTEMMAKPAGEPRPAQETAPGWVAATRHRYETRKDAGWRILKMSATCAVILSHCILPARQIEAGTFPVYIRTSSGRCRSSLRWFAATEVRAGQKLTARMLPSRHDGPTPPGCFWRTAMPECSERNHQDTFPSILYDTQEMQCSLHPGE